MSNIKHYFTIKELEEISAVSAHTIRIWERRYQLFQPHRTSNNRRYYDLNDLQYLLNIDLLRKTGLKISKIALYSKKEVFLLAEKNVNQAFMNDHALVELKLAMYGYDADLFEVLYQKAIKNNSFKTVFKNIFIPFLYYLGLFWHTKTITIAHEHFITNLISQKILLNTTQLKPVSKSPSKYVFVLYLPEEEMHEIGLLYLNYELKSKGYQTIYLGRSIPLEDLKSLTSIYPSICWIGNFVISPNSKFIATYFNDVKVLLSNPQNKYWAVGQNLSSIYNQKLPERISIFNSLEKVLEKI